MLNDIVVTQSAENTQLNTWQLMLAQKTLITYLTQQRHVFLIECEFFDEEFWQLQTTLTCTKCITN